MLQFFNRLSGSIFVRALFAVLLFAFIIFGIGDVLRGHGGGDTVVADVGDHHITSDQLNEVFARQVDAIGRRFGAKPDPAMFKKLGFMDHVLDALIDDTVTKMAARDGGFVIGDKQALSEVQNAPIFQDPKTKAFSREQFTKVLEANQYTPDAFLTYIKGETATKELEDTELQPVTPPQMLLDGLYRFENETRRGEIIRFAKAGVTTPQATPDQLQQYYHAHEAAFTAPEYRTFSYLPLTLGDIAKSITIPPDQVDAAYQAHEAEFQTPERRELQQVTVQDEGKAQQIATMARGGKSLADAARAAGADQPNDLGLMAKSDLPQPLQDPVFSASPNTIMLPVKSEFGWHVVQVKRVEPARQIPLAEAKAGIEADLKAQQAQDRLAELDKKIDDQLAGGAKLVEAGQPYGIQPVTVTDVDSAGHRPDGSAAAELKGHEEVLKAVFMASPGTPAQMQDDPRGGAFAVQVNSIKAPALLPFDTVKGKVAEGWQAQARDTAINARATQLLDKLKTGTAFGALSKEANAIVMPIGPFVRTGKDKSLSPEIITALFDIPKAGQAVIVPQPDGPVLVDLTEVTPALPKSVADTAPVATQLQQQLQADMGREYNLALRQIYGVKVHDKVLESMRSTD